ncbi:hypothetical protein C1H46_045885 [Malus baccata]|uniref:Uncharacterized protein n=1 Tax=Malus baccata TaxID=106549 RepID=A0A540K3Y6_MALBA|nr:hypothetical protein C1H46_045885 [Malus baccata]
MKYTSINENDNVFTTPTANYFTSTKIPSTPTATAVLAMQGINSRRPPPATPPSSNYRRK